MTNHHDELRVAPDPARAEALRRRLHERLASGPGDEAVVPIQDALLSMSSSDADPDGRAGDLMTLDTEDRPREDQLVVPRRSSGRWLLAAAAAAAVAVVGTVLVASGGEDDDEIDTVTTASFEVVEAGTLYSSSRPRYSPDGSLLAVQSIDQNVLIHDATTLTPLRELRCPTSLEYLPESVGTAPSGDDVWDVAAAARWDADALTVLTSVSRPLLCSVTVSADGSRAVTDADVQGDAPRYGRSLLWDTSDGSLVAVIPGLLAGFSTDGSRLVMSNGPSFSIVDSSTGEVVRTITDEAAGTVSSPDGSRLLRWGTTTNADGTGVNATIYDMQTLTPVATLSAGSPDEVVGIEDPVFDDTSGRVAALDASGVTIWDASTGAELQHVSIELALDGRSVAFSPGGSMIAARNGSHITIFDSSSGVQLADLDLGADALLQDVVFSPDGVSLAANVSVAGRQASFVRVWFYDRTD